MDFQKYNIKERSRRKKEKKRKEKQEEKTTRIIKTPTTTTQRLYMVFALKNKSLFFLKSNSRL